MASYNKVFLMGNLTRDPELRYTPKGTAVADIGLAVNRRYRVDEELREEVTFVDITFWGRQAETIKQYLTKGGGLFVEGRLQLDTWQDQSSGQQRSKLKIVGENFQFVGKSGSGGGGGSGGSGGGGQNVVPMSDHVSSPEPNFQGGGSSAPAPASAPPPQGGDGPSSSGPGPVESFPPGLDDDDDQIPF